MTDNRTIPLSHPNPSARLRAALTLGTAADPGDVPELVRRCAVEPDFFVRDMLTWALTRMPASVTVPALRTELDSTVPQARAQALHTLSKLGAVDGGEVDGAWPAVAAAIADPDDEVARAAWRAAVVLAPSTERRAAADLLVRQLGRGDEEVRRSLSRAILGFQDDGAAALAALPAPLTAGSEAVRDHVADTRRLLADPDSGFAGSVHLALREAALGGTSGPR